MYKLKYYLVEIKGVKYLTHTPNETLTINQCNSTVFKGFEQYIKDKNQCVFEFFGVEKMKVLKKLDRRTKEFKELESLYSYFSAYKLRLFTNLQIN